MLVLTRKEDEKIVLDIGDIEIVICICKMARHRVQIGIDAPQSVRIKRQEIHKVEEKNNDR